MFRNISYGTVTYYQIILYLAYSKRLLSTDNIGFMSMLLDKQQSSSRTSRTNSYCSTRSRSRSKSCNRVVVGVILILILAVLLLSPHQVFNFFKYFKFSWYFKYGYLTCTTIVGNIIH